MGCAEGHLKTSGGVVKDPVCLEYISVGLMENLDAASLIPESEEQPGHTLLAFSGQAEIEISLVCLGGHWSISCGCWVCFLLFLSLPLVYVSVPSLIFSSYRQT